MELNSRTLFFASFCTEKGLYHQFSSARMPQQKSVVERKDRTLVEMAGYNYFVTFELKHDMAEYFD